MPALGCEAPQGSSDPFLWGRTPAICREVSSGGASLLPATAAYSTWSHHLTALPMMGTVLFTKRFCFSTSEHMAGRHALLVLDEVRWLVLDSELWEAMDITSGLEHLVTSVRPSRVLCSLPSHWPCSRQWLVSAWVPEWAWHWEELQVNPHWSIRKVETSLVETTERVGGCLSLQHSPARPD